MYCVISNHDSLVNGLYSGNLLQEEIFANLAILLSAEIFAIFEAAMHLVWTINIR